MNPHTTPLLVVLALAAAPAMLTGQSATGIQTTGTDADPAPTAGTAAHPPARLSVLPADLTLVPRVPALAADSLNPDRNAGWYALGGAFLGFLVATPAADRETARLNAGGCMAGCNIPGIGIELLGAGLGAVGGLIVRKIVQH